MTSGNKGAATFCVSV